jgi:hypothetical protein
MDNIAYTNATSLGLKDISYLLHQKLFHNIALIRAIAKLPKRIHIIKSKIYMKIVS